jgi:ABC-type multidrug transport system ATPase subunit
VLRVEGLGFAHPKQPALFANWPLAIAPGVTWLGGDESTGKTTLLRLLAGELSAQQGSLRLNGVALADLIDGLALESHLSKSLTMLSTGTKRKVFLAGTLASGGAVTLLDEPFAALDRASVDLLLDLLQEAAKHPSRAWVVADYVAPRGVGLAGVVGLGGGEGRGRFSG